MIYNSSRQDDLVRYENPEEYFEEEEYESNNNKSYIDFNYDSDDESNKNTNPEKGNLNSMKQDEPKNNHYSAYFSNLQHVENNFNFNYESELEKIELGEIKSQINKENISITNTKNSFVPISTIKTAVSNKSTDNKDNFNLNDTIKLNNERKPSALDKYKIQPNHKGSYNLNMVVDNKSFSSVTNINNSRDLKKFLNVDVASNTNNDIKHNKSIIEEEKVKQQKKALSNDLINNSNINNYTGNVQQSQLTTIINSINHNKNKQTKTNNSNSDKLIFFNDQGDEDIDIELEAVSIQITNFNKSFEIEDEGTSYNKPNKIENIKLSDNTSKTTPNPNISYVRDKTVSLSDISREISKENKSNSNQTMDKTTKELKEQNKQIAEEKLKLIQQFEEINLKLEKKNREALDFKAKHDNLLYEYEIIEKKFSDNRQQLNTIKNELIEKENLLNAQKQDLKKKDDLIQNQTSEILNYQNQIENIKSEFTTQRSEVTKKAEKITELQQRIFLLEQENLEIRSKSNTEVISLRDQKQNFDILKSNYFELKNQNDLLKIKTQSLTDENTSIKRDLILYEKEIKSKNEMIETLKSEMNLFKSDKLSNYSTNYNTQVLKESPKNRLMDDYKQSSSTIAQTSNPLNTYESSLNTSQFHSQYQKKNSKSSSILDNSVNVIGLSTNSNYSKTNIISHDSNYSSSKTNNYGNKQITQTERSSNSLNKKNSGINVITTNNILPSQKEIVKNESKILEIEIKLYTLQQERDKVMNTFINLKIESELSKLPEFPKQKAQIIKKKNLELSVSEYAQSINKLRVELRELNVLNRDY